MFNKFAKRFTRRYLLSLVAGMLITPWAWANIPIGDFFQAPALSDIALSPDGKNIALIRPAGEASSLSILNVDSNEESVLLDLASFLKTTSSVKELVWLDSRYVAAQLIEMRQGIKNLVDTKATKRLLIIDTHGDPTSNAELVKSVRTNGWLVHPRRDLDDNFYYAKSGPVSHIYAIRPSKLIADNAKLGKLDLVDGGQFVASNSIRSVQGYALRWFFDSKNEVRSVLYFNRKRQLVLDEINNDSAFNTVKAWSQKPEADDPLAKYTPIALTADPGKYLCLDDVEETKRSIYLVDFKENNAQLVYETNDYEIVDIILAEDDTFIGVEVLKQGKIQTVYIDDELTNEKPYGPSSELHAFFDPSLDGSKYLRYTESYKNPGSFYLEDKAGRSTLVAHLYPELEGKLTSRQTSAGIVLDDLEIPYILTLPTVSNTPFPLLVMPHGGPLGVFDDEYYDAMTQMLVTQGYAVLRVNFRGSSGYTPALREAGKREWGQGMLSDIYAVTQEVHKRKDIDSTQTCVIGFSYGGYAASMLAILHPESFNCAVSVAGVSDLPLFVLSHHASDRQREWLKENVGDPTSDDLAMLNSISPVYQIGKVSRPLLIAHGAKDATVDVEHSYRLKLMMERHQKPFEFYVDDTADHHFAKDDQLETLLGKVMPFIAENIASQTHLTNAH